MRCGQPAAGNVGTKTSGPRIRRGRPEGRLSDSPFFDFFRNFVILYRGDEATTLSHRYDPITEGTHPRILILRVIGERIPGHAKTRKNDRRTSVIMWKNVPYYRRKKVDLSIAFIGKGTVRSR